ncbi:hypothetical protein LXL04_031360 [Taraxacum kok-saghyz]
MSSRRNRSSSRRSPSLSSTSSSSLGSMSIFLDDSPSTPATPLRYFGIPFSWEQFPGIPKKNSTNYNDSSQCLLPLPPSGNSFRKSFGKDTSPAFKKYSTSESFHKDPFFAAFVECSKDEELVKGSKVRSTSGLASIYTSCKRTCEVAESIVYLPRSRAGYFYR